MTWPDPYLPCPWPVTWPLTRLTRPGTVLESQLLPIPEEVLNLPGPDPPWPDLIDPADTVLESQLIPIPEEVLNLPGPDPPWPDLIDPAGTVLESQLLPIPEEVLNLPGRNSTATAELVFQATNLPPLGFKWENAEILSRKYELNGFCILFRRSYIQINIHVERQFPKIGDSKQKVRKYLRVVDQRRVLFKLFLEIFQHMVLHFYQPLPRFRFGFYKYCHYRVSFLLICFETPKACHSLSSKRLRTNNSMLVGAAHFSYDVSVMSVPFLYICVNTVRLCVSSGGTSSSSRPPWRPLSTPSSSPAWRPSPMGRSPWNWTRSPSVWVASNTEELIYWLGGRGGGLAGYVLIQTATCFVTTISWVFCMHTVPSMHLSHCCPGIDGYCGRVCVWYL